MYFPNKMPHLKLFDFRFFHKSNVFLTNGGSVNTGLSVHVSSTQHISVSLLHLLVTP